MPARKVGISTYQRLGHKHVGSKFLCLRPIRNCHVLVIRISNPKGVCYTCAKGLDGQGEAGVLKQLSDDYPGLTIRLEVEPPPGVVPTRSKDFVIRNGRYDTEGDQ